MRKRSSTVEKKHEIDVSDGVFQNYKRDKKRERRVDIIENGGER